jgi:hypothetical protein
MSEEGRLLIPRDFDTSVGKHTHSLTHSQYIALLEPPHPINYIFGS